jgi:hypothetical protein
MPVAQYISIRKFGRWMLTGIFVLIMNFVHAQQHWPFELWHEGKIVLATGDTLKGLVKYDLQQDLVQHMVKSQQAEVYTARKVMYFEIFDESIRHYRRFFTLPFATATGYKTPLFFELLEEGKMTLLTREFLEYKTYNSPYYAMSYSRLILNHKYYFLKEDGSIIEFTGNKNDLLDMMGNKSDDVEKYMKVNHLRFDDVQDLARIVDYYNSLYGS